MIANYFSNNIRQFMEELFVSNEQLALSAKQLPLTDEELEELVRRCFSESPEVISSLDNLPSTCKSRIRIWRSEFNRGLWGPQKVYSFRYGEAGKPINRHGRQLTPQEVRAILTKEGKDNASALKERTAEGIPQKQTNRGSDHSCSCPV